jgi:hypothetical protein
MRAFASSTRPSDDRTIVATILLLSSKGQSAGSRSACLGSPWVCRIASTDASRALEGAPKYLIALG